MARPFAEKEKYYLNPTSIVDAINTLGRVPVQREGTDLYLCLCGLPATDTPDAAVGRAPIAALDPVNAGKTVEALTAFFKEHLKIRAGGGGHVRRVVADGDTTRTIDMQVFIKQRKRKIEFLMGVTECEESDVEGALKACEGDTKRTLIHLRPDLPADDIVEGLQSTRFVLLRARTAPPAAARLQAIKLHATWAAIARLLV